MLLHRIQKSWQKLCDLGVTAKLDTVTMKTLILQSNTHQLSATSSENHNYIEKQSTTVTSLSLLDSLICHFI